MLSDWWLFSISHLCLNLRWIIDKAEKVSALRHVLPSGTTNQREQKGIRGGEEKHCAVGSSDQASSSSSSWGPQAVCQKLQSSERQIQSGCIMCQYKACGRLRHGLTTISAQIQLHVPLPTWSTQAHYCSPGNQDSKKSRNPPYLSNCAFPALSCIVRYI